jgi:hypothetical protein
MSDLNIAVLMWYDSELGKRFANNAFLINEIYCKKHGYDLIHSNKLSGNNYRDEPPWEKVPMILDHIGQDSKYDYVIWIDADAHFYVDRGPITDVIDMYKDRDIILSQDLTINTQFRHWVCNVQYPGSRALPPEWAAPRLQNPENLEHEINTGIMIIKNTQKIVDIVKWWSQRGIDIHPALSLTEAWDQGVLRKMWLETDELCQPPFPTIAGDGVSAMKLRDHGVVLPYGILQHFDLHTDGDVSPYVRHFCGRGKDSCDAGMLDYLEKIAKGDY